MKVTIVNRYFHPDESATSRMVTSLASSLAAHGYEVTVVASRHLHNDTSVRLGADAVHDGIRVKRIRTTGFGRSRLFSRALDYASFHLSALWALARDLRRSDVCIVCTDPPMLSVTAMLPIWLRGATQVNWLFDLFPEVALDLDLVDRRSAHARLLLWLRDTSLRHSRLSIAPMNAMVRYLAGRGIPRSRLSMIEHWSDGSSVFPLPPGDNALRRKWGLSDKTVIGYSGNLGRAHEFETLLGAAERLKDRKDIVFLFVGGGYRRDWVEAEANRRGLDNVVMKPLQPRDQLNEALAVPDVHIVSQLPDMEAYIIPSKFYGIAAAGRPCIFIGSHDSEIALHIEKNSCGLSVEIGDVDGLEEAITRLADWDYLRPAMGENARRMFDAFFTETRGVEQWVSVLERFGIQGQPTVEAPSGQRRLAN